MNNLKQEIKELFEVSDLREPDKIVGIEINCDKTKKSIMIMQVTYIDAILKKYRLEDANSITTPMDSNLKLKPGEPEAGNRSNNHVSLVGSLMYAAIVMWPNIAYVVN